MMKSKDGVAEFASEIEAYWIDVVNKCSEGIFAKERAIEMDKAVLELAKKRIKEEEEKQKDLNNKESK